MAPRGDTCFSERDPELALSRRAAAEGVGTLLLMFAASGSALTALRLVPGLPLLGLMASAVATAGALVGLILAFGSVSGGHFNPLITGLQLLTGERKLDCAAAYVAAQVAGGIAGAVLGNAFFGVDRQIVSPLPDVWMKAASEILATAGLMIIVFGCARSGRTETGAFAVGAWLAAAIIAAPSTSYANPALTLAALVAAGPIALAPATAALYIPAEVVGALVALLIIATAYPRYLSRQRRTRAVELQRRDPLA